MGASFHGGFKEVSHFSSPSRVSWEPSGRSGALSDCLAIAGHKAPLNYSPVFSPWSQRARVEPALGPLCPHERSLQVLPQPRGLLGHHPRCQPGHQGQEAFPRSCPPCRGQYQLLAGTSRQWAGDTAATQAWALAAVLQTPVVGSGLPPTILGP